MKTFNAFQLICVFVAFSYFIQWLGQATFNGSIAAFYTEIVVYIISFIGIVLCVDNRL